MADYTITLSDAEVKALDAEGIDDPQAYVSHWMSDRAMKGIEKIVSIYTTKALDEGVTIPSTREEIVLDAFERGWVKTTAERNTEMEKSLSVE